MGVVVANCCGGGGGGGGGDDDGDDVFFLLVAFMLHVHPPVEGALMRHSLPLLQMRSGEMR